MPGTVAPTGGGQVQSDPPVLTASTTKGTYTDLSLSYHFQVRSGSTVVSETTVGPVAGSTVNYSPAGLSPNTTYTWRVQATYQGQSAPWSPDATFKTIGKFKNGANIFDPLLDGTSVGIVNGGRFIIGKGWQSASLNDAIDYDIPTCNNCVAEFDVTGFGKEEGASFEKDVKWFTMGDAGTWNDFGAFRNSPWKMHLEQRSDSDRGMKLIWRNGDAGEDDPGDHEARRDDTEDWNANTVYHFVFSWNPGGFSVTVNGHMWFQDGFNGAYNPPNHRVELGCTPRGESFVNSATFSNFRMTQR
ncbi:MAG TPA: fibronectin type III domain-containing protein [Vicinamibacterales bacterium]